MTRLHPKIIFFLGVIIGCAFTSHAETASQAVTNLLDGFVSKMNITSKGSLGEVKLTTAEGDFPTISVAPAEELEISLSVPSQLASMPLKIRADDGGTVIGGKSSEGATVIDAVKDEQEALLKFKFALGGHRGRYSIKITAPNYMQILEFWVGEPLRRGDPGPNRKFEVQSVISKH